MRRFIPIGVLLAASVALAACSGSAASPSAAPSVGPNGEPAASSGSGGGAAAAVTIKGFAFAPADVTITVGTTVTWTNDDSAPHTVTFEDGTTSERLDTGATYSRTFDAAGTFAYVCAIHPQMKATVTVTQ